MSAIRKTHTVWYRGVIDLDDFQLFPTTNVQKGTRDAHFSAYGYFTHNICVSNLRTREDSNLHPRVW